MIIAGNSKSPLPTAIPPEESEEKICSDGHFQTLSDNFGQIDLPDVQLRAIELTIQGLRDTHIAQTLGLNPRTLHRWKTQNENYQQALALARANVHRTTIDRCENIAQQAMVALASFLDETNESRDRLKAIQIALTTVTRFKPEKEKPRPRQQEQTDDDFPMPVLEPKVG